MDAEQLKTEFRLAAIEYLLVRLFAGMTRSVADDQFDRIAANWSEGLDRQAFARIPPEQPAAAAEVRAEVSRLLDEVKATRKMGR